MLSNYFKIALRNLSRQKGFALLNIAGLAVGIAAVLLIFRMISYELSFNTNFANYDRIVRIVTNEKNGGGEMDNNRGLPLPAMQAIKNEVPQLVTTARIKENWPNIIVPNENGGPSNLKFITDGKQISYFTENSLFDIFDFKWLAGDPKTALSAPNSLVITRQTAEKCYQNWENALGKTLLIDNDPMLIKGIIETPPPNCEFQINVLISYETILSAPKKYDYRPDDWGSISTNDQMFGLLGDITQRDAAAALISELGQTQYRQMNDGKESDKQHAMQPLADMHYNEDYGTSGTNLVSKERLWILGFIGCLVLLMACFNFINLSTAQALRRSNEVGVRKTLGGSKSILFGQFMSETAIITSSSAILGVALAGLTAPLLIHISDVPPEHPFLSQPIVWTFTGGLTLIVTLLSGFYPALVLSGFNPIQALKNNVSPRSVGGNSVRKGLVVFQFAIAQVLIVGTLITLGQLNFIRNRDLGFRKDLVYIFHMNPDSLTHAKLNGFKQRLAQIPGVRSVAFGSDFPSSGSTWETNFSLGRGTPDQKFSTTIKFGDGDYLNTFDLHMVAGRWLEPSDTVKEYVVNETLLKKMGISSPETVLGQELRLGNGKYAKVVGVMKDFNAHSLHREVSPLVMSTSKRRTDSGGLQIEPANMTATVAAIQREYDQTFPEQVFYGRYYDEMIAEFYTDEARFSATCKGFGMLAIFISCLGLFGLAAHAAQRRTKEIGVRKVLGASVQSITGLLTKDFLSLVLVAVVCATPVAWYLMKAWLADFAYRVDVQWWIFALAGAGALAIAFLTVSYQSIKAALANPVKSLRSE
jgi:putative ABC transport system permease protein